MTFKPTEEQENIVSLFEQHGKIKVSARSGAGKTSSLRYLTSQNPDKKFLYLAFNRSMAEEAASKMPDNTSVMTTHSLAYRAVGKDYAHKLTRPAGRYVNVAGTGREIALYYGIQDIKGGGDKKLTKAFIGLIVRDTVNSFERSASRELEDWHIPKYHIKDVEKRFNVNATAFKKEVMKLAKLLWKDRSDGDSIVLATHDTYLKLYHLSNPDFSQWDTILLDESQDSSDIIIDLFKDCPSFVAVGDNFQAIYAFRGAVNAMEKMNIPEATLTKSFRFGESIAKVASGIIRSPLYGAEWVDSKVGEIDFDKQYTIIYRKNLTLISEAVDRILDGENVYLNIDVKDFISLISSAKSLRDGKLKGVKHDSIIPYSTWGELVRDSRDEPTLKRLVKIINDEHEDEILHTLGNSCSDITKADVVMTTAHKSKGLEYNQVIVADDFLMFDKDGGITNDQQEINLLYVAITRAKYAVMFGEEVESFLMLSNKA